MSGVNNGGFEDNEKSIGKLDEELNEKEIGPIEEKNNLKNKIRKFRQQNKLAIRRTIIALLNIIVGVYFAWATYHHISLRNKYSEDVEYFSDIQQRQNETDEKTRCDSYCGIEWCDGYGMLLLLLFFVYLGLLYFQIIKPKWGSSIYGSILLPFKNLLTKLFQSRFIQIGCGIAVLAGVIAFLVFDTVDSRDRLRSLIGMFGILGLGYIFSNNRSKIKWRPVIFGFTFQFLLGVICIRWEVGRSIFECFGDKVATFLYFGRAGSTFVFGETMNSENVFAFAVLPVIFFFSFCISILYYYGAMQWFIVKLGWILQSILGTTVCESVIASANIFLGMSESPILIMPYIKILTHSEIHAIMASGFATVSGTVLAAYISFGAEPAHLITSSVMAAPAALCFAKLFYPETEESKTSSDNIVIEESQDSSVLDAASKGATLGISLVLGIIANLVAFVSFIAFLNAIINWLGWLGGEGELTFEWIFGRIFIPLSWALGVEWEDCGNVGVVIANKVIINEFVAYQRLGELKENGEISLRSSAIATYAICGFANPSSLGILIGSLTAMCPERRPSITAVAFRAFIAGCCICFITASIAGLLMDDSIFNNLDN